MTRGKSVDAEGVAPDLQSRLNADQLGVALAHTRNELSDLETDAQRARHEQAIDQMENYVALLRDTPVAAVGEPTGRPLRPFAFKLEFDDGRWDIGEKQLVAAPQVGDVFSFEGGGSWRVRTSELVHTRPAHKPMRELFMCAPAA